MTPKFSLLLSTLIPSFHYVTATSYSNGSIYLYSGTSCSDPNPIIVPGLADGICTQITNSFWSFELGTLDDSCTATVYARDNPDCGGPSGRMYEIYLNQCVGNDTGISQFSVDCPSRVVSSADPSGSVSGLSTSKKLGLGIGIPVGTLIIVVMVGLIWWCLRRKSKAAVQDKNADSPPAYEMAHEKRGTERVEIAGQQDANIWVHEIGQGMKQHHVCELDGKWEGSEVQGSSTTTGPEGRDGMNSARPIQIQGCSA